MAPLQRSAQSSAWCPTSFGPQECAATAGALRLCVLLCTPVACITIGSFGPRECAAAAGAFASCVGLHSCSVHSSPMLLGPRSVQLLLVHCAATDIGIGEDWTCKSLGQCMCPRACACARTHARSHTRVPGQGHTHIHAHTHVHTRTHTCTHTHTHTYTHTHT